MVLVLVSNLTAFFTAKATWLSAGHVAGLVLIALAALLVGRLLLGPLVRVQLDEELFEVDNPAMGFLAAGYFLGIGAVFRGVLKGHPEPGLVWDLTTTAIYTGTGVLLVALSVPLTDKLLLPRFKMHDEIVRDRNAGTGVVVGTAALAFGLLAGGAVQGHAPGGLLGGLAAMIGAYVLGALSLAVVTRLHARLAGFDSHGELEKDNVAAGLSIAGAILGSAIVLAGGLGGDFDPHNLRRSLSPILWGLGLSILILPVGRLLSVRVFFGGIPFDAEIRRDRNVGAGVLDFVAHVLLALLIVGLWR